MSKEKEFLEAADLFIKRWFPNNLELSNRVERLNTIRSRLHTISPFTDEPVDFVKWIPLEKLSANDYNPNTVAPPEMELLKISILNDGYTQPIVAWRTGASFEVVDGFHRNRVAKEDADVRNKLLGYIPITIVRKGRTDRNDRIASTIRHNRARGKHKVDSMSDIVLELKNRNWTNDRIARELGMDQDEILRLCQITGLSEMFSDEDFSRAWDVEGEITEEDFKELSDSTSAFDDDETKNFRVVNTDDENRIFHTYKKWECYKAGFYATSKPGMTKEQCEEKYAEFLADKKKFSSALHSVITEWKHSCEHYLTNSSMNRIAWLGQASACYAMGIPSVFRSGFNLLTERRQVEANKLALKYLNIWLKNNNRDEITLEEAMSYERQSDIY